MRSVEWSIELAKRATCENGAKETRRFLGSGDTMALAESRCAVCLTRYFARENLCKQNYGQKKATTGFSVTRSVIVRLRTGRLFPCSHTKMIENVEYINKTASIRKPCWPLRQEFSSPALKLSFLTQLPYLMLYFTGVKMLNQNIWFGSTHIFAGDRVHDVCRN